MLTRQEIEQWHDPPCNEQAEWLLKLADRVVGSKLAIEEMGLSMTPPADPPSTNFLREKAEECLALSYQIDDPKKQLAILKLASWWMRLAEQYLSRNSYGDGPTLVRGGDKGRERRGMVGHSAG